MTDFCCLKMFVCRSMILSKRVNDDDRRDGFTKWPFMTTHAWGEYPQGDWLLEVRKLLLFTFLRVFAGPGPVWRANKQSKGTIRQSGLKLRFWTDYIVISLCHLKLLLSFKKLLGQFTRNFKSLGNNEYFDQNGGKIVK